MIKRAFAIRLLCAAIFILPFVPHLNAWEPAIKIAPDGNEIRYHKPVIKTGPDGQLYFAYKNRAAIPNTTDIHLQTYDGSKLGVLGNINVSAMNRGTVSYEQDIEVGPDGRVHVAWMYYKSRIGRATPHQLLYRVWDGKSWSKTKTLLNFTCNYVEDTRMTVSPNGNVHVTWMTWDDSKIHLVGLYPQGVEYRAAPMAGRHKHPDVTSDDTGVHLVWQYRPTGIKYNLAYAQKANKYKGDWTMTKPSIARPAHDVVRPRITIDENKLLHVLYHEEAQEGATGRKLVYFNGTGSTFNGNNYNTTKLFDDINRLLHCCDIAAGYGTVFAVEQDGPSTGGGRIFYDWKKSGTNKFSGIHELPYVNSPLLQSVSLSPDGQTIYVLYQTNESSISLITSGPVVLKPVARGKVDVSLATPIRTVLRSLLYSMVKYQVSWSIDNEDDLATITAVELHRSPKGLNTYTLLKNMGVNEITYTDRGDVGSGDLEYDYMVRVLWNDTLDRPHYSDSFGNTDLIEDTTSNITNDPQHQLR